MQNLRTIREAWMSEVNMAQAAWVLKVASYMRAAHSQPLLAEPRRTGGTTKNRPPDVVVITSEGTCHEPCPKAAPPGRSTSERPQARPKRDPCACTK